MRNPLLDFDFLRELDVYPHRTVYAKIILLNLQEQPVKEITGRITTGSVNVDGASAVRRSCSLTLITDEAEIDNIYWGIKNKFKLEVGLENFINSEYPDIIWFKQGLYVITSLNETLNATSHNISLSGKDKGCLLNGEFGGTIPSTTNFGKMDYNEIDDDGNYVTTTVDLPIKTIIQNAMLSFGGEQLHNIVISDIDNYGMELIAYKGADPLYMMFDEEAGMVTNMVFDGNKKYDCKYWDSSSEKWKTGELKFTDSSFQFNTYVDQSPNVHATIVYGGTTSAQREYTVIKIDTDEAIGYRKTELTYPGDLIANAGEALTSVLDKIKNMFASFEYFYDIDGRFVFQKKKDYINASWNNIKVSEDEVYVDAVTLTSPTIYSFEDNKMLTAISKQPAINNLKNDFAIQGTRKSASGADILIHMRYAISDKPYRYKAYKGKTYVWEPDDKETIDWRELIYQMALDYFKYGQNDDFYHVIGKNNPEDYPTGITGYEMFYTDLQGFWRQLYNPEAIGQHAEGEYVELPIFGGTTGLFHTTTGFNKDVEENPSVLNFWFDFMDTTGEFGKYSIQTIGHRPKAVNDSKTVSIYYKQIPQVLLISSAEIEAIKEENLKDYYNLTGYSFIQVPSAYEKYFSISSRGKSAQDSLDDLLYKHLYCTQNVTLTSLPIYYLQPNQRIFVRDQKTQISGEYLLNKITIPLTYNGTSSLTAQLAPQRIY